MNQLTIASHNHKMQLWISRISECKASSLTVADWCLEHGVSIKSYYYWMRKMKEEAFESLPAEQKSGALPQKQTALFAQVTLPEQSHTDACTVRFRINGIVMEIQNGAASQTIESVLRVVNNLC